MTQILASLATRKWMLYCANSLMNSQSFWKLYPKLSVNCCGTRYPFSFTSALAQPLANVISTRAPMPTLSLFETILPCSSRTML